MLKHPEWRILDLHEPIIEGDEWAVTTWARINSNRVIWKQARNNSFGKTVAQIRREILYRTHCEKRIRFRRRTKAKWLS